MREIGKGYTALKTLCGYMNISPPMTSKTFSDIQNNNVIPSYIKATGVNMKNAADELRSGVKLLIQQFQLVVFVYDENFPL